MTIGTPVAIWPTNTSDGHILDGASPTHKSTVDAPIGSLICAFLGPWNNNTTVSTFGDGTANSYTLFQPPATTAMEGCTLAYSFTTVDVPVNSSFTATTGDGGGYFFSGAFKVSGIVSSSPLDTSQKTITAVAGTSLSLSTGTLLQPGELIVAFANSVSATFGASLDVAGFTTYDPNVEGSFSFTISYRINPVPATTSITWNPSWPTSATYAAVLASFKGVDLNPFQKLGVKGLIASDY